MGIGSPLGMEIHEKPRELEKNNFIIGIGMGTA